MTTERKDATDELDSFVVTLIARDLDAVALVPFGAVVESAALRNFADFALPKDYLGLLSHPI